MTTTTDSLTRPENGIFTWVGLLRCVITPTWDGWLRPRKLSSWMVTPPSTSTAVQTKRAKRGSGAAGRDKSKENNRKNFNGEANRKAAGLIAAEMKLSRQTFGYNARIQHLKILMEMTKTEGGRRAFKKARSELYTLLNRPYIFPPVVNLRTSESSVILHSVFRSN